MQEKSNCVWGIQVLKSSGIGKQKEWQAMERKYLVALRELTHDCERAGVDTIKKDELEKAKG